MRNVWPFHWDFALGIEHGTLDGDFAHFRIFQLLLYDFLCRSELSQCGAVLCWCNAALAHLQRMPTS